jgi:hypothetical protein
MRDYYINVGEETFCTEGSRLRHFIIICKKNEYKRMDRDKSLGKLCDVLNQIKISDLLRPNLLRHSFVKVEYESGVSVKIRAWVKQRCYSL